MSIEQARHLIAVKRFGEAKAALNSSLADPRSGSEPWCLLAQAELGDGRNLQSKEAARRALAIEPERTWALRLLAMAELRGGRKNEAQEAAARALALEPESAEAAYTLISVLNERRRFKDAEAVAARSLQHNAQSALLWEAAAAVSLRRSRWPEAEQRARAALAIDPQDADVLMILGVAAQAQGRHTEAGELYAAAARIDPTDNRGRAALGELGLRVSNSRFPNLWRYLALMLPQAWIGLAIGTAIASHRQWRARSGLSPHLREIARREQRAVAGTRLFVIAMVLLALSVLWLIVGLWPMAIGALALSVLMLAWWRWWAPHQARHWLTRLRR